MAEGRRSRGVHPVVSDSGGCLDVGFSRLRLGLPQSPAPGHYEPGAPWALEAGFLRGRLVKSRVEADESCSVRGFDKNRDAKSARRFTSEEPRDAGEPVS